MKMKFKNTLAFLFMFLSNSLVCYADVGGHNDYSSGGSLDGAIEIFRIIRFLGVPGIVIIGILLIILMVCFKMFNKNGEMTELLSQLTGSAVAVSSALNNTMSEETVVAKVTTTDPSFDIMQFKGKVSNMYISLQEAWEKKDWKIARPFETDQLFNSHANMLREMAEKQRTNIMDEISVRDVTLTSYSENSGIGVSNIKVKIKVSQIDYIRDDLTNQVIKGDKNRPIVSVYEWTLTRKLGVMTEDSRSRGLDATSCPNCGAPISVGASGQCEYCGSVVTTGEYDWVLAHIKKLN